MARLRNIARDVITGVPIVTGSALIEGPDGTDLETIPVNASTGVWDFDANGSPGRTVQTFTGGGQTKVIDGFTHGQAGYNFEGEFDRIWQLFGDGVLSGLAVTAPGGMAVAVGTGNLFNLGVLHPIYVSENVTIAAAHATLARIDRVVSRLTRTGVFEGRVVLAVLAGTPAASPVVTALTQDATTWEVEVAQVTVPAAAGAIVLGNIDTTLRPIASGPLADGSVTTAKLADNSVTTAKIVNGTILLEDLNAEVGAAYRNAPGLVSTYWVSAHDVVGGSIQDSGLWTLAPDTLYASIVSIPKATTLTGIGIRRVGGSSASATGRLGLYSVGSNGLPSALFHDAGTVDLSTVGAKSVTGLSVALPAGFYWAAICAGTWAGSITVRCLLFDSTTQNVGRGLFGVPSIPSGESLPLTETQGVHVGTGALPNPYPSPGLAETGPLVWVQTGGS